MARFVFMVVVVAIALLAEVAFAGHDQPVRLPVASPRGERQEEVRVEPGDHLWKISARYLEAREQSLPVAPYWRRVIELNVDGLRSGDPNLIYPGEIVRLPDPVTSEPP